MGRWELTCLRVGTGVQEEVTLPRDLMGEIDVLGRRHMLQTELPGAQLLRKEGPHGGRTRYQDGCPTSFVITMSHSENNGRHHVWESWVQLQLGKEWEEGEYTQGTYPH